MKYRKKPVVIEAVQWTDDNEAEMCRFTGSAGFYVLDIDDQANSDDPEHSACLYVAANSTWLGIRPGEWVLKDSAGFYPCKADIFEATYEAV